MIPEGMGQSFEDDKLGIVARAQQRAMKNRGVAQQQIARAGHEQARRHAMKIRVER